MPRVKLSLTFPDSLWITEITHTYSDADLYVLTTLLDGGIGHAVLEIESEDASEIVDRIEAEPPVRTVEVISSGEERTVIQVETSETYFLDPLTAAGVPLQTPIRVNDGIAYWEVSTSKDRLSNLTSNLREMGVEFGVERVGYPDDGVESKWSILTDRQAEIFRLAYQMGYFEVPREATIDDVASEVGIQKSTASDILRRAIRNLVTWYTTETGQKKEKAP